MWWCPADIRRDRAGRLVPRDELSSIPLRCNGEARPDRWGRHVSFHSDIPSGQRGSSPGRGCAVAWTQPTVRPFGSVHNASLTIPIIACTLDAVVVNAHKIVAPTVYAPTPAMDISRSKPSFLAEFRPKQCRAGVQCGRTIPNSVVTEHNGRGRARPDNELGRCKRSTYRA